jgi:hypothetical protein
MDQVKVLGHDQILTAEGSLSQQRSLSSGR